MNSISKKMSAVTSYVTKKAHNISATAGLMAATMYVRANQVYCGLFDKSVSITTSISATSLITNVMKIIAGVCILVGMFMILSGVIKFLQARAEDNAAGESKAGWSMGIGLAFVAMPLLINTLFGK